MKHKVFGVLTACLAVVSMAKAEEITMADIPGLPGVDVVILGEVHDNGTHHQGQGAAIKLVQPKAVVFEMLTPAQAARVTDDSIKDQARLAAVLNWSKGGWPEFSLYYPVFAALEGRRVYGAADSRKQVRRAFSEGAAAVFGAGAERYDLDKPLPASQQEKRVQEQFEAHCEAMPKAMMDGMVEAQRLRDARFAATVLEALEEVGGPVVLITGNGHARADWGVPALLKIAAPSVSVLSVAFLENTNSGERPFDYWILTEPAERKDPCLAFK